jgi:23S rRNA G2445 N2-methylase RlmL
MVAAGWGGADAAGGTLFGCDKSEVVVKGAQANCTAAGIKNVTFEHVGAQGVDRL